VTAVVLGYGLCSNAVLGLRAGRCPLVMPRVDDCGSRAGLQRGLRRAGAPVAGTYYLSRGWIESHVRTIFDEHEAMAERYGEEQATRLTGLSCPLQAPGARRTPARYDLALPPVRGKSGPRVRPRLRGDRRHHRLSDAPSGGPWDDALRGRAARAAKSPLAVPSLPANKED